MTHRSSACSSVRNSRIETGTPPSFSLRKNSMSTMTYAVAFSNKRLHFRKDFSRRSGDHKPRDHQAHALAGVGLQGREEIEMNTKWKAVIIGGALLAGLSGTAAAHDRVNFSLSFGVPAPVYVAPPAPVYYAPPPTVYYTPAPVYYSSP